MIDFKSYAVKGVQALQPYLPGKPIEELERELGISNTLKLASNENPLGPAPEVLATFNMVPSEATLYPDGNGFRLKQAIADKFGREFNFGLENITLGNGSNDVLDMVARCFLDHQSEAIFSEYAFAVYPICVQAVGATAKVARALDAEHESQPYGHDLTAMKSLISDKTRVIFIANPNNPTGTWVDSAELKQFLDDVPSNIIVVVDEAYFEYVRKDDYPNTMIWLNNYKNLVVTRTFSKIYGLACLRVGYAVADESITNLLNRVRQPFNVNSIAINAATTALSSDEHVQKCVQINDKGLAFWEQALNERSMDYIPSVGNFITVDFKQDAIPIYNALLREGVIVRPVANYGLPHHLRITLSTEEQNTRCLEALDKVLAGIDENQSKDK